MTDIHPLLTPALVRVGLSAETKDEAIHALVDLLAEHPYVRDLEAVRAAVLKREAVMSTGVGKGLGLPHAKTDAVRGTIAAFAVTQHPVPFDAIDDEPVRLLFLLVGPDRAKSEHIKLLSRISRLMNQAAFREGLLAAEDKDAVLNHFEATETALLDD